MYLSANVRPCSQAERFCIAEREGVHCRSDHAQAQCLALLDMLRHQARFALKANDERSALPHGKAIRLQVGGMRGLSKVLDTEHPDATTIGNVDDLLTEAERQFGVLEKLPYSVIMREVAAYQVRRRSRRRT